MPGDHIQLIVTPEGRYRLLSKNKVFQEMKDSNRAIEKELFVRPNQCWYSAKESRPFADFFDSRVFSNERFKFQLRQTGDEVELRRRDDISKHTLVMKFSLELDGNLTSYELTPDKPAEGQTTSRTFEWARLPDKQLYVTKIHQETRQGRQSPAAMSYLRLKFEDARGKGFKPDITIFEKPTEILTIEFKNFNPDPHWTTDPFNPTLWKIDPRVMVERHDGANVQRYRYGNQKTTNTEALNKLADELASQGFGVP